MMRQKGLAGCVAIAALALIGLGPAAWAADAPAVLKLGTLYAGSGAFAVPSTSEHEGLKFWVDQVNAAGGTYVKALGRKVRLRLIAYNDRSSTTTAAPLYNQLITQDKVDILVSDFGSVLTSVAVPIAQTHKMLLFDPTGTGAALFSPDNPYVVLCSLPTSAIWPYALADFLRKFEPVRRVALLYATNDFTGSQAATLRERLRGSRVELVYDQGVATNTSNYAVLLHNVEAARPDAVIEFGYANNDIAFLQGLQASGLKFKMVFAIFPGQLFSLLRKNVSEAGLAYTYTYPTPPLLAYNKVNYGPGLEAFLREYRQKRGEDANFLTVAGYNTGLVIGKTLATADKLDQLALRRAVEQFSGKLFTLDGLFKVDRSGAQVGELLPVGQFLPSGNGVKMQVVFPFALATGKPVYPAP